MPSATLKLFFILFLGAVLVSAQTANVIAPTSSPTPAPSAVMIPQPLIVGVQPDQDQIASDKAIKERQEARDISNAGWQKVGIVINGILFLIIIVQALLSRSQLKEMQRQSTATENSLITSKSTQRAYVSILGAKADYIRPNEHIPLHIEIVNGGATPTKNLRVAVKFQIAAATERDKLRPADLTAPDQVIGTLQPNRPTSLVFVDPEIVLTQQQCIEQKAGNYAMRLSVLAFYEDIFGEKHQERSEFGLMGGELRFQFIIERAPTSTSIPGAVADPRT